MKKYSIDEKGYKITVSMFDNDNFIGQAVLSMDDKVLKLNWIEIEEEFQYLGNGTEFMNYLVDHCLGLDCDKFKVNVADEQILSFYIKWLKLRGFDSVKIDSVISEDGEHPVIDINRVDLEQQKTINPKI